MRAFPNLNNKLLYSIGNSNTYGYGLADPTNERWAKLLSARFNGQDGNGGDVGATVTRTTYKPYNWASIPNWSDSIGFTLFLLGTNDALQDSATITVAAFYAELRAQINRMVTQQGYPPSQLALVNINYMMGYADRPLASQAPITARNAKILDVAHEFNTCHVDMYSHFLPLANKEVLFPDGVHMAVSAHQIFANKLATSDYTQINNQSPAGQVHLGRLVA